MFFQGLKFNSFDVQTAIVMLLLTCETAVTFVRADNAYLVCLLSGGACSLSHLFLGKAVTVGCCKQ
uniref:Uncharacterized protein n=1 Tax=Meleagris gallopavo TaxID=9103 RepID=A0A803XXI4_MELGA